jgi:hypothetical protein
MIIDPKIDNLTPSPRMLAIILSVFSGFSFLWIIAALLLLKRKEVIFGDGQPISLSHPLKMFSFVGGSIF